MNSCRVVALLASAFCLSAVAVGQQGNGPRPGSDAPVLNYKAVPEWPIEANGDKGFPAIPVGTYWQVPSVAVEKNGNILFCIAAIPHPGIRSRTANLLGPGAM